MRTTKSARSKCKHQARKKPPKAFCLQRDNSINGKRYTSYCHAISLYGSRIQNYACNVCSK